MYRVDLTREDAFEEFRDAARALIGAGAKAADVSWLVGTGDMLGGELPPHDSATFNVPAAYVPLAEAVVCHSDPERFALLYELLWRITRGERELLFIASDPLVHRVQRMERSVRRDMHKMTAFLRFRRVEAQDGERYIAWFEPEHHILRRISDFFVGRFASMHWSILTPRGALHWDGKELTESAGVAHSRAPASDALEEWWRTYYRADVQSGPRQPRGNDGRDAEEILAQHARDRPDPWPSCRGRGPHAADGQVVANRTASRERHRHAQA